MRQTLVQRQVALGSLATQVYTQLRLAIIRGDLPPNSKLTELEIAQQMGTSQGTVREALQRLESEGLVERRPHRGTYVNALSLSEIHESFVIRSIIEGFAARRAVQIMTDAHICHLEQLYRAMRQSAENNTLDELIEYDLSFHRCICEWSGSRLLLNSWTPLYSTIQRFIFQTHPAYFADLHALADTHLTLIDAFRSRDEQTVVALIQEHVMLIWQMIGAHSNLESIKNEPSSMI